MHHRKNVRGQQVAFTMVGVVLPLLGSLGARTVGSLWENVALHSVVEASGALMALAFAALILSDIKFNEDGVAWVACALTSMAVFDLFHASVAPGNLFVWLHSIATLVGGTLLGLVWLDRFLEVHFRWYLPLVVGLVSIVVGVVSVLFADAVPRMVVDGAFTPLSRGLNVGGSIGFFAAAVYFYMRRGDVRTLLLAVHCALFGSAAVLFELSTLWDPAWWWWHALRLCAYCVGMVVALSSYLRHRQEVQAAVQEVNDMLGTRVEERTIALERANADLRSFSYSVSHDLRGPLRLVDGYALAVLEDSADVLAPRSKEHLKRVREGAARMEELLDGLLILSRVTSAALDVADVDLARLSRDLVEELRAGNPGRQVALVCPFPMPVRGDERLLRLLLQNLLQNAWKFTERIPGARLEVGLESGTESFFVKDNGIGFEAEFAERIFGLFERLHDRKTYRGSGIGLATARRIVHRHKGEVWARGEPGKGASIHFTLGLAGDDSEGDFG